MSKAKTGRGRTGVEGIEHIQRSRTREFKDLMNKKLTEFRSNDGHGLRGTTGIDPTVIVDAEIKDGDARE